MRLTTLDRAGSFGRSIFSPLAFFSIISFSACSYWSSKVCGSKSAFGVDDVQGEIEHVFRHFLVRDFVEIFCLFPYFVRVA